MQQFIAPAKGLYEFIFELYACAQNDEFSDFLVNIDYLVKKLEFECLGFEKKYNAQGVQLELTGKNIQLNLEQHIIQKTEKLIHAYGCASFNHQPPNIIYADKLHLHLYFSPDLVQTKANQALNLYSLTFISEHIAQSLHLNLSNYLNENQAIVSQLGELIGAKTLFKKILNQHDIKPEQILTQRNLNQPILLQKQVLLDNQKCSNLHIVSVYSFTEELSCLSPREIQVAYLIYQLFSNSSITETLKISHKTLEKHISAIYSKLEIKGRSALVSYLYHQFK